MEPNTETDIPPSPTNEESDGEKEDLDQLSAEKEVNKTDGISHLLQRLQNSGALLKQPKIEEEYHCKTCDEEFSDWEDLEQHLIQHVSLPSIIIDKLPSDDEVDNQLSDDDNWSEEDESPPPQKTATAKTPQKIDVTQLLQKTGLQIKKTGDTQKNNSSDAALSKLSGLGFTIKKNSTPIKEEKPDSDKPTPEKSSANTLMQKLGNMSGLKLKLKSDGNNANSFKVVNGLKDFKTSDDEEDDSANEESKDAESDNEPEKEEESKDQEDQESSDEPNSAASRKNSESDDSGEPLVAKKKKKEKVMPLPKIIPKPEPIPKIAAAPTEELAPLRRPGRPPVKQTPKRGTPIAAKGVHIEEIATPPKTEPTQETVVSTTSQQQRRVSLNHSSEADNVVVKQEVHNEPEIETVSTPLFSGQIKTERSSPTPTEAISTPVISNVKTEMESVVSSNTQPLFSNQRPSQTQESAPTTQLLPITKTENTGMTIIEINGDSGDDDDDCCVVSATPAPDIKPIIPKTENTYSAPPSYPPPQTNFTAAPVSTSSRMASGPVTEKQHTFNWNAPDTKPPIDMLERSADDIFESLLSSATKRENMGDASEYISLDRLGSQHTCDICNTRFTDIALLEDHIRNTGHTKSIIMPSASTSLMPYGGASSSLMSSLLPVKQLAEQVGKLSAIGTSGPGAFTHQQNVMINIQYPGSGMQPPPSYGSYPPGQNMPPGYSSAGQGNMYGAQSQSMPAQGMPGQYSQYMDQHQQQPYSQYSKTNYPSNMPQSPYGQVPVSSPYATTPLQSMQQAVYGSSAQMPSAQSPQMGQMGPPQMPSPNHPYQASSPGGLMKPPMTSSGTSGIRIQNVQTFSPGQLVGANGQPVAPGQVTSASPGLVRVAGPSHTGPRPRMPGGVRGQRPSIRPGIQVHGQVQQMKNGARMPLKRAGGPMGAVGPQKRRPNMLLPGKHDNEDCQVMAMQKQREGLPMIQSVQGAKDKLNLGSQISITKKPVNREANAMANVLASRGISINKKAKSRSPSPERPVPHIPNLGAGVSIKHASKSSSFSIPEAKVGNGMQTCKVCRKMFMNQNLLAIHMSSAHPHSKVPLFKCDECPASYPKSLQLQHHKRVFHNVTGPNRELGLPVVDLSQEENLKRLSNLGIYSFIPLANREQASGCFGIPVISVNNMQNGMTNSLQALGADGLLSLGPLKPLPNS